MGLILVEGMSYRQWQKRNSDIFNGFSKSQKDEARSKGYRNIGWEHVQESWKIVCNTKNNIVSLFEHKLVRGDLSGAVSIAIQEAEKGLNTARKAVKRLEETQKYYDDLANQALSKYPTYE